MPVETGNELLATVRALWPGAEVEIVRSRRRDPRAVAEYVVVPHLRAPRLLVPSHNPRAAARALRRFSAAASYRESLGRSALAAAVSGGGLMSFSDRIRVHAPAPGSVRDYISDTLGQPVSFSLGIGSARVNRKPVLQLFSALGRSIGFAKLGDSDQAGRDVRAEAAALTTLEDHTWQHFVAPRVLHHGTWNQTEVLVITELANGPLQRPRLQWVLPHEAMTELATGFEEEPCPLDTLPWTERQRDIGAGLTDPGLRTELLTAVDRVVDRTDGRSWPVGAWHGDWTPWNMARHRGRVQLWDWERFERGVPQGLDSLHYTVNALTRRDGASPRTIAAGLELAGAPAGDTSSAAHHLAAIYLLAAAGRYLPLTEAERGTHIAERARATLDALASWTH